MCGRFTLTTDAEQVRKRFRLELPPPEADQPLRPRFNAAPTQSLAVITQTAPQQLSCFVWGLIPSWSGITPPQKPLINARSETAAEKPTFRHALAQQRCLVPADGFYEWHNRQPYYIHRAGQPLFAFAGLWDCWHDPQDHPVYTFTILTREADPAIAHLHDRMPIILPPELEMAWLTPGLSDAAITEVIQAAPPRDLTARPVSRRVNTVRNDDPELLMEVPPSDAGHQQSLF